MLKQNKYWYYGMRSLERIFILIMPRSLSINKLYEEVEKIEKQYFSSLFIWIICFI